MKRLIVVLTLSTVGCAGALRGGTVNLPKHLATAAVTCVVTALESGNAIADATCEIEGQAAATDVNGEHRFDAVAVGYRQLVVKAQGHETTAVPFEHRGAEVIRIPLKRSPVPAPIIVLSNMVQGILVCGTQVFARGDLPAGIVRRH